MLTMVLVHHRLTTEPAKDDRYTFLFESENKPYVGQVVLCDTYKGTAVGEIAEIYDSEEALWVINRNDRRPLKVCRPAPEWATDLVRKLQFKTGAYAALHLEHPERGRPRPIGHMPRPAEEGYRQPRH